MTQRRRVAARARFSLGKMDGIPTSRTATMGGARLHRTGARFWLCRTGKTIVALHRAVHLARSNPDARVLLDDVLRHAGECAAHQTQATDRQRTATGRTHRRAFAQRASACGFTRRTSDRSKLRAAKSSRNCSAKHRRALAVTNSACIFSDRVGTGGGCVAVGKLGGVSRCRPARPQDTSCRKRSGRSLVDLRASAPD